MWWPTGPGPVAASGRPDLAQWPHGGRPDRHLARSFGAVSSIVLTREPLLRSAVMLSCALALLLTACSLDSAASGVTADGRAATNVSEVDDLDDAVTQLVELADDASVLVVHLDDDGLTPLASHEADTSRAVASIAKLYVVDAVAQAVSDGELAWDDPLEVTDEDRSAPSGRFQDEPAGTTASVRELATAAILLSDNTATDLLLTAVGRDRVEEAVVASGHADPTLLSPFLRTRELFAIGWDDQRRAAWADAWGGADTTVRADLVARVGPGLDGVVADDLVDPAWRDGVDWWASTVDLVGIWTRLLDRPDPVLAEVLIPDDASAPDPVVALDDRAWERVGFKNGALPGVSSVTFALEREDGEQFLVAVALNGDADLDTETATALVDALIGELAGLDVR